MFKKSRSKRANRNAQAQQAQVPPTSAAAIAALQATGAQSIQDGRLAAGAAAAALRSRTSSPVNVGEVQTKRTLRRASMTSETSNPSRPTLSRSGSQSSMTSRTFRSPSPHGRMPAVGNTPPVPPIPRSGATSPSSMTSRSFRRPASTEPTARVVSPPPQDGYRNMSVDAATRRASKPSTIKTSNLADLPDGNGSRNSVNFSRPMSPENRPISPSPTSPTSSAALTKMGYGTTSPRDGGLDGLDHKYQEVANRPVHKKKGLGGDEGSHLAAGTMGSRATGTAVDGSPAPRPKRIPLQRRITEEDEEEEEFEEVYDPHTRKMVKRRKPGRKPKPVAISPRVASPTVSSPARQREPTSASEATRPAPTPASKQESQSHPLQSAAAAAAIVPPKPQPRDLSTSPARKARFSTHLDENPSVHEPARSLTPTKSALRKSPSPRGMSPADSASKRASWNQPGFNPSEASEAGSFLSDDRPKRRSVRVSFDERPTIVGTSATPNGGAESPTIMSPQNEKKKNWFGLRKNKASSEDTDEGMAPTPALPSFGSVRGRRPTSDESDEPTTGVLGIPGVALTTGEQTPSEAGSRVDETDDKEHTALAASSKQEEPEQANGNIKKMKSGNVPMIAVIPGTPAADKEHDPMSSLEDGPSPPSPVQDTNPAALGIAEPEPEEAAAAHDPNTPVVGHVRESIQQQTEHSERMETDSQDSHYSDAPEGVDGDGFGSINAIVESPPVGPESPKKKLAESLPPLTDEPPAEILPVPAVEAAQGAEATTYREATAAGKETKQELKTDKETTPPIGTLPASLSPSPPQQKSPLESISYSPRRMNSTSSSRDISPDGPRRFAGNKTPLRSDAGRALDVDSDEEEAKSLTQSGPYPRFEKSPRQSFQDLANSTGTSPDLSQAAAANTPQKRSDATNSTADSTPARAASEKKPLKSALKQTNRASMQPESSPSGQPRGTLQKKGRPVSGNPAAAPAASQPSEAVMLARAMAVVQERRAKEAKEKEADVQATLQRARATSLGSTAAPASKRSSFAPPVPKLRRRGSGDSDSSFKRGPSSVTSEGGRVSMRRSMRSNPPARPQSMATSGSFHQTMRSNPSQRSRPTSMVSGGMGSRTMRREPSPPRSILGLKKPQRSASVQNPGSRRLTSRFDVDSDDDDPVMPAHSSRFRNHDSEQPRKLRPVRGIPHRTEEVDSSDLDSDGELPVRVSSPAPTHDDRLMEMARQRLGIEARPDVPPIEHKDSFGQSDLVEAFREKKPEKKSRRASIFGSLSRRKNQDKVVKDKEESIARRDTHLERTALQRKNTGQASLTSTPERPGASRQNTAERIATLRNQVDPGSWPLPESPGVDRRPDTSDGSPPTTVVERPTPRRHISADSAVYGRSGKKKRFPFLRRAFGLHD